MITSTPSPRVGVTWLPGPAGSGSQFEARRLKLNAQIDDQNDLNQQTIDKRKKGKLSDGDWSDYQTWQREWAAFVLRWGAFSTSTSWNWITGPDEQALQDYEQNCYALRQQYESLGGVVKSSVPLDKPYKPEPSPYDWAKLLTGALTVGVVGLAIYYGGKFAIAYAERRKSARALAGRSAGLLPAHASGELEPFTPPEGYVRTS